MSTENGATTSAWFTRYQSDPKLRCRHDFESRLHRIGFDGFL